MEKGDIIRLEYDLYVKETGELYETTSEELAKEKGVHEEGRKYEPLIMVVEPDKVIKGLESSLMGAKVGEDYEVEIQATEAYGERDPKQVELHSMREILRLPEFKDGENYPDIGMKISYKNRTATIARVTAGRVRLDFNHPLAGKTLKYRYKVLEKVEGDADVIRAIVEMDYGTFDGFEQTVEDDALVLKLPERCKYDQGWFLLKYRVVSDLRDKTEFRSIRFVEEYSGKAGDEGKAAQEKHDCGDPDCDGHHHDDDGGDGEKAEE